MNINKTKSRDTKRPLTEPNYVPKDSLDITEDLVKIETDLH